MTKAARQRRFLAGALLVAGTLGIGACGTGASAPEPVATQTQASSSAPAAGAPAPVPLGDPGNIPVRQASPEASESIPAPVRVQVEGTGIDLEVVPVGVEENGAMTIPDNHFQAGWYRYGPAPGAASGSSVLAAHVDSQTEVLPIASLKDVEPGTRVIVTREDGTTLTYQTEKVENIAKRSLDGHRLFDRTGGHLLKLVTCGGKWLDTENDYEDNVVLTATPVS
ncbi:MULTISPECIES: class F sortase [Arthrobacter]|uniref:Class F sortase n=1 Tax=Arthrobacter caoxuetaonis TaxID=2886935 RepID=A0A9X1MCV4_9MICC|nr:MULTISPECIES: class F sortase [Arthrobacter]MCC3282556.1 class F sortase [Arthrobacter caoxuetaonis]MCC3297693.1 class F sortase [Arthrobacter caoxuetaonis]MCC9193764.1 class F sortase [Arthrobacter sp. zg-Y916]USQ56105.1 class F sortase [Arthrobacter caoxuetaonis]